MNREIVDLLLIEGKKGNKEAMDKLFEIHKGLIYKYSTKYFIKGYDREDLEQIGWIEFINGVKKYDGSFGIDFVAFITILLRNKYGSMLKRKELTMKFSSLDTPIGEDITMKDTLEDSFSMEKDFENREEIEALIEAVSALEDEEREFILYINEERGNMQKYYEAHKNEMTFNAVRYKKKKIMDKIQKAIKNKGIKVKKGGS
ncbi:MAG: sigma-70 family RNA polymerase sigma factor [Clostridium perfringens]|nr:sigma-70 family RNA polymerase sigma factor [Clostridium perfringens]MDU6174879.1 sigma-70 family RNA polymerase sigma factor [Clostridium perfringens]